MGGVQKVFQLHSCAQVLILQLKRFSPVSYDAISKCHRRVVTPPVLDLYKYTPQTSSADQWTYTLEAIVTHDGGMGGGHYMTYAHTKAKGWWSWYSDQVGFPRAS